MENVSWEQAQAVAATLRPLRTKYITTQRHLDVESNINMLLAAHAMNLIVEKGDRKLGLLLIGESGAGKSTMLKHIFNQHPYLQPQENGQLRFASFRIPAPVTNKALGHQTASALGYDSGRITASAHVHWGHVRAQILLRSTALIHFDEAQDLFLKLSAADARDVLSTMKGLTELQGQNTVIVLSGGPELESYLEMDPMLSERFYRSVLRPLHPKTASEKLIEEMHKYAGMAGMKLRGDIVDMAQRIIHASFRQFGRSLEIVIDGIQEAAYGGAKFLTIEMLADAYQRHTNCGKALNIFLADNWAELSPIKISSNGNQVSSSFTPATSTDRKNSIW